VAAWLVVLTLAGCATARVPVALRTEQDSRAVPGEAQVFMLPEGAVPQGARAWAQLSTDSLILYRPTGDAEAPRYRREVHRLGASGLWITGYTLTDGRKVPFRGYARRVDDQLHFHRMQSARTMEKLETTVDVSLAVGEVRSIDAQLPDTGQTVIVWGAVILMSMAAFGAAVASSLNESLY
jgi:hypothetical protein